MKILVPISRVPDTTAKISFTDNNTKFNKDGVQFIMNPVDEWYALVRAIELKEQLGGTVTAINVGLAENDQIIRKALAIGADIAVRVNSEPVDAAVVASEIVNYAKSEGFDMVLTGKETIDFNGFEVGPMIAEMLDMPFVHLAVKLEVSGNTTTISREIEGGWETVEVELPLVLGCSKGIAEQRIPNMRGIMAARTKPLTVIEPSGGATKTEVVAYEMPDQRSECTYIDPENMDELVRLLNAEAKVI